MNYIKDTIEELLPKDFIDGDDITDIQDFDELLEMMTEDGFEVLANDIEYNVAEANDRIKGKLFVYLKAVNFDGKKISSCFPMDFLKTSILYNSFEALKLQGKHNPSLNKGRLVSNKRQLRGIFVSMGVLSKTNYPAYYKQCFEEEPYNEMLSQYFSYELLRDKEIQNYRLTLDESSEYFKGKADKLKSLGANNQWHLEGVYDTLGYGQCTLGHNLRYLYRVKDNFGNMIGFGRKCVSDFFLVNGQVQKDLLKFVYTLRNLQSDYLNAYLTNYEEIYHVEKLFVANAVNRLKDDNSYKLDLQYANQFIANELPLPRPLATRLSMRMLEIVDKREFSLDKLYKFYVAFVGLNGVEADFYEIEDKIALNYHGDRISPKLYNTKVYPRLRSKFGYSLGRVPKDYLNDLEPENILGFEQVNKELDVRGIVFSYGLNIDNSTYRGIFIPKSWTKRLVHVFSQAKTREDIEKVLNSFVYTYGLDLIANSMDVESTFHFSKVKNMVEITKELMLPIYKELGIPFINSNLTLILTITKYEDIIDFMKRPMFKKLDEDKKPKYRRSLLKIVSYKETIEENYTRMEESLTEREERVTLYEEKRPEIFFLRVHHADLKDFENSIRLSVSKYKNLSDKQWARLETAFNRVLAEKEIDNPNYWEDFKKEYKIL